MHLPSITGWQEHIRDGHRFLKTAEGGLERPAVFNNELIFQLAAMAIEKLIMGMCQYHRHIPDDHTLSGLAAGADAIVPMNPELACRIGMIEQVDDMCSMSPARRVAPGDEDIRNILDIGGEVADFVGLHVPRGLERAADT